MNLGIPSRESLEPILPSTNGWLYTQKVCAWQKEIFHFCSLRSQKILLSPILLPLFNPTYLCCPHSNLKFPLRTPMNSGCQIQWSVLSSSSNLQYTTQLTKFPPVRTAVTYPPENLSLGLPPTCWLLLSFFADSNLLPYLIPWHLSSSLSPLVITQNILV